MKNAERFVQICVEYVAFVLAVITLVVLLSACGREEPPYRPKVPVIAFDLVKAVDEFYLEADARGLNSPNLLIPDSIVWDSVEPPYIGLCFSDGRVVINENNRFDGYKRIRAIVFHELGHCVYDVDHDPNPESMMHAEIPWEAEQDWKIKVDMLFNWIRHTSPLL